MIFMIHSLMYCLQNYLQKCLTIFTIKLVQDWTRKFDNFENKEYNNFFGCKGPFIKIFQSQIWPSPERSPLSLPTTEGVNIEHVIFLFFSGHVQSLACFPRARQNWLSRVVAPMFMISRRTRGKRMNERGITLFCIFFFAFSLEARPSILRHIDCCCCCGVDLIRQWRQRNAFAHFRQPFFVLVWCWQKKSLRDDKRTARWD